MFLNNRYHDPTLGAFISVDPLVVNTGQAYIYASANPVSYSDPSGMCGEGDPREGEPTTCEGNGSGSAAGLVGMLIYDRVASAGEILESVRVSVLSDATQRDGALQNLLDFTKWEIRSRRVADDGGSAWWEVMNGVLVQDIDAALSLIDAGYTRPPQVAYSVNLQGASSIQLWMEFFLLPTPRSEGQEVNRTVAFWKAHQGSLNTGSYYAEALLGSEPSDERAFIAVVMSNVNWTDRQLMDPDTLAGHGVGIFINHVLDYPTDYPFEGDASRHEVGGYSGLISRLVGEAWPF